MLSVDGIHNLLKELAKSQDTFLLQTLAAQLFEIHQLRPLPELFQLQDSAKAQVYLLSTVATLNQKIQADEKAQNEIRRYRDELKVIASLEPENGAESLKFLVGEIREHKNLSFSFSLSLKKLILKLNDPITENYLQSELNNLDTMLATFVRDKTQTHVQQIANHFKEGTALKELIELSLTLHSERYISEVKNSAGAVHIIHFYPKESSPRAAEYLEGYDSDDEKENHHSFNKTSHGLGSGVYGVGKLNPEQIMEKAEKHSCYELIEISNPLRLANAKESDYFSEISKGLQFIANKTKELQNISKNQGLKLSREAALHLLIKHAKVDIKLIKYAEHLKEFKALDQLSIRKENIRDLLVNCLMQFLNDSKRKDSHPLTLVSMPINYLIALLGFDGVVSKMNDRFNRGLIAMDHRLPLVLVKDPNQSSFKKQDIDKLQGTIYSPRLSYSSSNSPRKEIPEKEGNDQSIEKSDLINNSAPKAKRS